MMRNLINNQKGSVLSVAFIVIALLSFSITATTVYSFNIANRTSNSISTKNEELFAREIIKQIFNDLRLFINEQDLENFDPDSNFDTEELIRLSDEYNNLAEIYYLDEFGEEVSSPINITVTAVVDDDDLLAEQYARIYSVTFELVSGRIISRDLLFSLQRERVESDFDFFDEDVGGYDGIFNFLEQDLRDNESVCDQCDINELASEGIITIEKEVAGGGANNAYINFEKEILLTSSFDVRLNPGNQDDHGVFNLNSSILYIKGNLTVDNIRTLSSDTDRISPGFILVEGDIDLSVATDPWTIDNVVVIAKNNILMDPFNKNRNTLQGENFMMLALNNNNQNTTSFDDFVLSNNLDTIYSYCVSEETHTKTNSTSCGINEYYYLGTRDNFNVETDLLDRYEDIFNRHSDGSLNPYDFDYAESAFREIFE